MSPSLFANSPSWLALEPRIMFDGAAVATAGTVIVDQVAQQQADTATSTDHATTTDHTPNAAPTGELPRAGADQALFDALAAYDAPMARQEIAFVSPSVRDYQHLLDGISSNVETIVLDPTRDGVTQIAETLAARTTVDAVHLIAEGAEAELRLGTSTLTQESLSTTYAQQFRQIGQSLTQSADILVYGCNFGRGEAGQLAISTLASLTGADVAASTNLTGAAGLGGDWTLEVNTGVIESDIAVTVEGQAAYGEVLDITTGLLGHWTFDSNANDSSGNNYNGTLTNGATIDTTTSTNLVGVGKLSLDGVNDYVNLTAYKANFQGLTQGTVAMWIKTTDTGVDLFDLSDTADNSSVASLWITGSGKLSFEVWENNSDILRVNSVASVNDGQWHHVAVTVNGSGNKLYIDGVQASVTYVKGNSSTTAFYDDVTGIDVMEIGRFSNSGGPGLYYTGLIDDIRVYNRALSSGDMGEIYATSNDPPTITNLTGDSLVYTEGDGAVVIEQGGNATVADVDSADFNTGTLTVSFATGSDSAEDVLGVRHQGTGAGQIGVSGATVTYGGTTIGTVAGGSGGANLVITLNSSATPTAVAALVKNITYENTDTAAPTMGARTVRYVLTDGDGGTSAAYDTTVTVSGVNDAPVITSNGGGAAASINVAENTTAVTTVTATDVDAGQTLSYSLSGGADAAKFAIDSSTGVLSFLGAPNYEAPTDSGGNNVYDVTVQVSDGNGGTDTQALAITVTNLNEAPVITSNGGGASGSTNVTENTTAVTTVTATEADFGQTLTYSISGGADAAKFAIDSSTGVLSFLGAPNYEAPTDSGGNNVYDVTVQVSDGNGGTDTQALAITVTNLNEAPVITSNSGGVAASINVAENNTAVTTVTATDVDAGQTLTYSLAGGADQAKFTIDTTTGVLSFLAPPDYENPTDSGTNNVYNVTVQVSDGNGGTDTQALAITVTNLNEAPVITSNGGGASGSTNVTENTTAVTTVTATEADFGQTLTYSISGGADVAKFTIDTTTGVLSFLAPPDYENPTDSGTNNVYDVTVQVSDGNGGTDAQDLAVTVVNVNGVPTITSNGGGVSASINVAENTTAVTTVTASDVDPDLTLIYSLSGGADQAFFTIDSNTGVLTFISPPDFETPADSGGNNIYDVTVQVTDGDGGTDTQNLAVTVTNVNAAPVITSNGGGVSGNTDVEEHTTIVTTVTATDVDAGQTLTYSLSGGTDQTFFTINSSTGVLSFISAPDFEVPIDSGGNNVYDVTVQVDDGNGGVDTQALAVTVTDINVAPVITSNGGGIAASINVSENNTAVTTVAATDADASPTLTYSLSGGADQALFAIDSNSGVLTFISAPDFEVPSDSGADGVYDVTVQVDDGEGGIDMQTLAVMVTNVNEAPIITGNGGGASASINVAENSTAVTSVTATDVDDGQTLTYGINGGADAAKFTIDSDTGVLSFLTAPNFEAPTDSGGNNVYDVTVQVSDGNGGTDVQALAITVTNLNEAPVITSNSGGVAASINVAENNTAVTTVAATDVDAGQILTYSLSGGADQALFAIDSNTGVLTFLTAPDYEIPADTGGNNVYDVTVQVSDGNGGIDTQTLAVTLTNVNELPVITSNGGGVSASINVAENSTAVTSVTATDVDDGQTLTYSLSGGADQALFMIDSNTGVLTFISPPDFETPADSGGNNVYDVTVQVNDGNGGIDTQALALPVTNLNEAPVITSNGGGASGSINVAENSTAVTMVTATDVDAGQTLTYSLSGGADAALFTIDSSTGALSFVTAPDFEAPADFDGNNIYDVTVQVSDGNGGTDTQSLAIVVTNANDAPVLSANTGFTVAQGGTASIASAELQVTDIDNTPAQLTYTVTVGPVNGQLQLTTAFGIPITSFTQAQINAGEVIYVHNGSLTAGDAFTFTVSDGAGGNIAATTFGITVTGVNSTPTLAVNGGSAVVQGLTDVITAGELQVVDLNNTSAQLVYAVTNAPSNGQLELTTNPGMAITTFTQADIDAGHVVFVQSGAVATSDSFTFTVSDGFGGTIGATTFTFTVAPFIPPPGDGGGSSGGAGASGGTGGTGSGSDSRSGFGTSSTPGRGNGFVPPSLEPAPMPLGTAGPGKEVSVVDSTHDLPLRIVTATRMVARIEQPDIAVQELPRSPAEQLPPPIKQTLAVGHKLVEQLTRVADDLERQVQERESQVDLVGRVASFSGVALSAGFVAWILRGGSLIASFLVSMPAWRRFDPLPVLWLGERDRRKLDRTVREADEHEKRQFRGLDRVLKSSTHGRNRQNRRP